VLQIKDLRVGQWKEPCIRLTQENLIENSVQDCLPYILIPNGPCELFLAYPKWPCVCLKINMCCTHCMMSSFQNLLHPSMCHVIVIMSSDVTCCVTAWSCHSNPNPSSKNRIKEKKIKMSKENKKSLSPLLLFLTSRAWKSRWADECGCEKGSQNTDKPKNMKEKEFRRISSLTKLIVKSVIGYLILVSIKQVFNPAW